MLDAIGRRNTIRFMMARGELGGAHMADGYARVSGGLGVLFSSTGPGAANAIGGLIEARFPCRLPRAAHHRYDDEAKFADRELGSVDDPIDQLGMMRSRSAKSAYRGAFSHSNRHWAFPDLRGGGRADRADRAGER